MDTQQPVHEQALAIVMPAIEKLLAEHAKRQECHIVIMNPQKKPWECSFEDAVLYEYSHYSAEDNKWERDYRAFALSKAKQAWREQQHNVMTQTLAPATLRPGDTFFYGSFNYYGVIVACSGVEPYFDMLISTWVATTIQQLTHHAIAKHRAAYPDDCFLPQT